MPRYRPSPRIGRVPSSRWATVRRATMTSLRLPGQQRPTVIRVRRCAPLTIWVLTRFYRAGTHATAMSQHCLCGTRVVKTLKQRTHDCPHCGLRGVRDIISAALAACVELANPDDPRTARVDYRLAHALRDGLASQQEWEGSVNRHQPPPSPDEGSARTGSHHPAVTSAERAAPGTPPNRPRPRRGRRGTSRKQPAPKLIGAA
jgi:hypothetical protein